MDPKLQPNSRGVLVLDAKTSLYEKHFTELNIHIVTPMEGMTLYDVVTRLLPFRTLLTCSPQEYIEWIPVRDFNVISLAGVQLDANPDPLDNRTVQLVSRAIIDWKTWHQRYGWVLTLKESGPHEFEVVNF